MLLVKNTLGGDYSSTVLVIIVPFKKERVVFVEKTTSKVTTLDLFTTVSIFATFDLDFINLCVWVFLGYSPLAEVFLHVVRWGFISASPGRLPNSR